MLLQVRRRYPAAGTDVYRVQISFAKSDLTHTLLSAVSPRAPAAPALPGREEPPKPHQQDHERGLRRRGHEVQPLHRHPDGREQFGDAHHARGSPDEDDEDVEQGTEAKDPAAGI